MPIRLALAHASAAPELTTIFTQTLPTQQTKSDALPASLAKVAAWSCYRE